MNPYESPSGNDAVAKLDHQHPRAWRTVVFGMAGSVIGYILLTILANLEQWQFYTIRSFVTGRTAMSEIVEHPADGWVQLILLLVFTFGGLYAGLRIARRTDLVKQLGNTGIVAVVSVAQGADDHAEPGVARERAATSDLKSTSNAPAA